MHIYTHTYIVFCSRLQLTIVQETACTAVTSVPAVRKICSHAVSVTLRAHTEICSLHCWRKARLSGKSFSFLTLTTFQRSIEMPGGAVPAEGTAGLGASSRLPDASPSNGEEWRDPTCGARRCAGGGPGSVRPMSALGRSGAGRCGAGSREATLIFFPFFFSSSLLLPFLFLFPFLSSLSFFYFHFPFFFPPPPFCFLFFYFFFPSSIKTIAPSPLNSSLHHRLKQVTTSSFLLAGHLLSIPWHAPLRRAKDK